MIRLKSFVSLGSVKTLIKTFLKGTGMLKTLINFKFLIIFITCFSTLNSQENKNILLLYDNLNKKSEISILYLKERLISDGIIVKDIRIKDANKSILNYEKFEYIIIYSEVRAFHMRKQLKKWLSGLNSFKDKKVALFITSITEKYGKKVTKEVEEIVKSKNGYVLDAVSSATGKLEDDTKKKRVETFSREFIKSISNSKLEE